MGRHFCPGAEPSPPLAFTSSYSKHVLSSSNSSTVCCCGTFFLHFSLTVTFMFICSVQLWSIWRGRLPSPPSPLSLFFSSCNDKNINSHLHATVTKLFTKKGIFKNTNGGKKNTSAIKQKWKMWEIRSTDYSTHANEGHVQNHRQVYWKWYLETVCDSSDSCKCALWDGLTQKNSMRVFQACVVPWFIPVLWHNL